MKLLKIINTRYLISSVVVVILLGISLSSILSYVAAEQTDEKIMTVYKRLTSRLDEGHTISSLPPYFEVAEIDSVSNEQKIEDSILKDKGGENSEEARQLTAIYTTNGITFEIIIRESKLESDDLFETITLLVSLAIVLMVSGLYFLNYKVTKSVWQGFYENLTRVKQFSLQEKKALKLQASNVTEFKELNEILENLTNKAINDYQSLKQFTEDASHEIQTPLAVIRSKIESILNENGLPQKQAESLRSIDDSVNRLVRLNKNLLLLTKLENQQFLETKVVSFSNLLNGKINEWKELLALKGIKNSTNFNNDIVLNLNPTLTDILITNLLSNAINHTAKGGKINIEINKNKLIISNSGIEKLKDPEALFNRFYKGNPASKSVGLGLSIVKKICDNYHIKIDYSYSNQFHSFAITFPESN